MKRFFDTNVLIYNFDDAEPVKQDIARRLITMAIAADEFVTGTQTMIEFYNIMTGKFARRMHPELARQALANFAELDIVATTPEMIVGAAALRDKLVVSWWDALILEAALRSGADVLYSEDLHHGLHIDRLRIENPFRHAVQEPLAVYR